MQYAHFIIKYSLGGQNTVLGITEYSFWFPEVGRSDFLFQRYMKRYMYKADTDTKFINCCIKAIIDGFEWIFINRLKSVHSIL